MLQEKSTLWDRLQVLFRATFNAAPAASVAMPQAGQVSTNGGTGDGGEVGGGPSSRFYQVSHFFLILLYSVVQKMLRFISLLQIRVKRFIISDDKFWTLVSIMSISFLMNFNCRTKLYLWDSNIVWWLINILSYQNLHFRKLSFGADYLIVKDEYIVNHDRSR